MIHLLHCGIPLNYWILHTWYMVDLIYCRGITDLLGDALLHQHIHKDRNIQAVPHQAAHVWLC
jgi:hypothetical protein